MLIFGFDIPLVEIMFTLVLVTIILLIEAVIIILLLVKQMNDVKKLTHLVENKEKK